jgi:glycerate 2-kinase
MKIVIAPDSFKGSLSAVRASAAIARGVRDALPDAECDLCPMADGGEGTVEALLAAAGGEARTTRVVGPLGEPVEAHWGLIEEGRTAVIEIAEAAGLGLVPEDRRDPARTTSYGVGELIRAALDAGARRLIVGVGGSATNDGGAGMAQALGVRFIGPSTPHLCGGALEAIEAIDWSGLDPRLAETEVVVASDVDNPLTGPEGAAAVYGPQKGMRSEQLAPLDRGLEHLARWVGAAPPPSAIVGAAPPPPSAHDRMEATPPPRLDARQLIAFPGAGAAGGLGFGLIAFCGARLVSGAELMLSVLRFDERVRGADLVLTGEGRLDGQSVRGKTVIAVAKAAARHRVPAIALAGAIGPQAERTLEHGLTAWFSLCDRPLSLAEAIAQGDDLLAALAANVIRTFRAARP